LSGTFINCSGGQSCFTADDSFGGSGITGIFTGCTGGQYSFSAYSNNAGTFKDCTGADNCFTASTTLSGEFRGCVAGSNSFTADTMSGTNSGTFDKCIGNSGSFAGSTLSANFLYSQLISGTFNELTMGLGGKYRLCIDGNYNIINADPSYNVVLLLHMNGSNGSTTFTDSSPNNRAVTAYGDAQISTTQSKFGGSSLYLDGDGDYLEIADSDDFDFGTGDWTIEFWAYALDNTNPYPTYIGTEGGWYTGSFAIRWDNTGGSSKFGIFFNPDDPLFFSTNTFVNNTWYHVAVVRRNNTISMYIDGVEEGSSAIDPSRTIDLALGGSLRIGWSTWDGADGFINDYIDELRIVKGTAIYTTAFTPPTAPF
jgi:hypothetical protein